MYILAIDQGTSSTKTIIFNSKGELVCKATKPLKTLYLNDGHVEQEPAAIYENVLTSVANCLQQFRAKGGDINEVVSCGISNQRETFMVWDVDGKPLYNAVVWQCKRSIDICNRLKQEGLEDTIRAKTGLVIDPYFSGTKLLWLYENNNTVQQAVDAGNAYFGTVDTWLLYKLTNGKNYFTDHTNASRTLFFNLHTLDWDRELLANFKLSKLNLPVIKSAAASFGESLFEGLFNNPVSINAMIGDSHAAAFGEGCFAPGIAKATLGTGCSILMNIGGKAKPSANGMVTTICWSIEGRVDYAYEGVIVSCGATLEWMKNDMQLIDDTKSMEAIATSVEDNAGVYLVPAFSGLGAPHWDMSRKASITGLTFNTTKKHIVRAALETIPYQIKDVIVAMEADAALPLSQLMVDGGITSNRFVLQFLADLLEKNVVNIGIADVSALGAAYLAGIQCGIFTGIEQLQQLNTEQTTIAPVANDKVKQWYKGWQQVIAG